MLVKIPWASLLRSCLAKWHGIEKGQPLTSEQVEHFVRVIRRWLEPVIANHTSDNAGSNEPSARTILHVDIDAFYASIKERKKTRLTALPAPRSDWPEANRPPAGENVSSPGGRGWFRVLAVPAGSPAVCPFNRPPAGLPAGLPEG